MGAGDEDEVWQPSGSPVPTPSSVSDQLSSVFSVSRRISESSQEVKEDRELELLDDSDGSDDYHLLGNTNKGPRKISEKKQVDAAAFEKWVLNNQLEIATSALRDKPKDKTISRLVDSRSGEKIITSPREYQTDLFERAKQKNIIVVLDTGSGKTLIAVLLMRHIIEQELENRANGKPKRVAFFLVEKVTLCMQQYSVLKDNLDYAMMTCHGNMTGKVNTKAFWDEQLNDNLCVVCTAQILLDCLRSGFITMRQINLIIFDEAHHAKKSHPYARIIKSYYMREPDTDTRPRILGMTASPVDSKTRDMRAAAWELESMMCSEIATVSNDVLEKSFKNRQLVESQETYDRLMSPEPTPLWQDIHKQVTYNPNFQAALHFTKYASSTLGPWCADRFWSLHITDVDVAKLVAKTENGPENQVMCGTRVDQAIYAVHEVRKLVKESEEAMVPVCRSSTDISPKVKRLWDILEDAFDQERTTRCIIFVEKRYTALLLADLLKQPGMEILGVKGGYMTGSQASTSMTFRDQLLALQQFKRGDINCLIATSVAEEGIDIPECDLVIRFDLYNSAIQYIQSKGRARQIKSRYISMIEDGNMRDLSRLKQASRDATALRQFCSALPEERKVQDCFGFGVDAVAAAAAERLGQKAHHTKTGARLSFENSIEILAKFASSLSASMHNLYTDYVVIPVGKKFIADVILPEASPINRVSGFPQRNKQLARCSAAFEACMLLLEKKFKCLDDHLQPVFMNKLPAMRNARLAVSSRKKAEYPMRIKPDIWSRLGVPTQLFSAVFALEHPNAVGRPSRPLILLSRQRLPLIPAIPLFFGNGHSSIAEPIITEDPLNLTQEQLEGLKNFTLKIFDDVFSKEFIAECDELPYFLAPSSTSHETILSVRTAPIDWETVQDIQKSEYLDWEGQPEAWYQDKFVVDQFDGSRKLFTHGINRNLKPSDPPPSEAPTLKSRAYRLMEQTIKEYSNSLTLKARKRRQWRDDQPVVDAELLSLRRNFLDPFFVDDDVRTQCAVILEPLKVSPLPVDIVTMARLFPAMLHRIDSTLIALDACQLLDLGDIRPDLALEAMTKDSDNVDEQKNVQLNFQAGMGNNYERLEFLGDCFLKMATTISLFTKLPEKSEFEYHVERMLLICNQNLFNHAVDRGLQEYIRIKSLDRRSWYPNLKLKRGKKARTEFRHNLADKSIADVCEALIGAAYLCNMDMAVKAVTKMVKSKNHKMVSFRDYYTAYKIPSWQVPEHMPAAHLYEAERVGSKIGHKFKLPALARSACKHPSWMYDKVPSYQQLEFLGDALLDMTVVEYLFRNYPSADPQWLTEHKMAMASNQFLGFLCVKLGLQKHLLSIDQALRGQISQYVTDLEQAEAIARQEAKSNSGEMRTDYWREACLPPKVLPDIVEAVVGAIFVDSGYDYTVVERFTARQILPYFQDMAIYDTFAKRHPVTALGRRLQIDFGCSAWRLCSSNVPCAVEEGLKAITETDVVCALLIHEKVVEHATAKSGRYAKIAVAKKAMEKFEKIETEEAYKAEVQCDCKEVGGQIEDHGTAI